MSDTSSAAVVVRDATPRDAPWMRAVNNAAAPAVNELTSEDVDVLVEWASPCLVAERQGEALGFVLALPGPGLDYGSDNYRRFSREFDSFLYVDRVVVDSRARSGGLGGVLYAKLTERAIGRWPRICAEVNVRPPNPRSLGFHRRHGFDEIGEQDTEEGAKRVALLVKPLAPC